MHALYDRLFMVVGFHHLSVMIHTRLVVVMVDHSCVIDIDCPLVDDNPLRHDLCAQGMCAYCVQNMCRTVDTTCA